ncbi:hypothetical protein, partial [Streptomyces sp. MZ04]|uniref:hypothetical protein n=1 Tax=Streptomyces sp. MZ04 TaxID=2559236 RepID=UPI001100A28B
GGGGVQTTAKASSPVLEDMANADAAGGALGAGVGAVVGGVGAVPGGIAGAAGASTGAAIGHLIDWLF